MSIRSSVATVLANVRQRGAQRGYTPPLRAAVLFSIPPMAILLVENGVLAPVVGRTTAILVLFVTVGYNFSIKGYFSPEFDADQFDVDAATTALDRDIWASDPSTEREETALLAEYEQISHEIRTSNSLAIRSTYFSLATLGLLATAFITITEPIFQPFLAEFGMFIAFAFLVTTEKHVRFRKVLRARQGAIERMPSLDGNLSVAHTWDVAMEHGLYPSADIGEQLVDFNRFWLWAWIVAYHASTIYTAFVVVPT